MVCVLIYWSFMGKTLLHQRPKPDVCKFCRNPQKSTCFNEIHRFRSLNLQISLHYTDLIEIHRFQCGNPQIFKKSAGFTKSTDFSEICGFPVDSDINSLKNTHNHRENMKSTLTSQQQTKDHFPRKASPYILKKTIKCVQNVVWQSCLIIESKSTKLNCNLSF